MYTLNQEIDRADLGEPVEVTAKAGDILFYHYLCAHSGSQNTTPHPRLALNHKW
jgi:ectoine hydroxylase-related dioxygenase (phytanoyl-CoA dioxygenase family)